MRVARSNVLLVGTIFALGVGIWLRFLATGGGFNYDFVSYRIIAEILERRGLVYMETWRYNYGPVWFYVLRVLDLIGRALPGDPQVNFRLALVALLTAVDLAIWAILDRRYGRLVGLLFFLNPISILITGYHNQFDNLAIALGMVGVQLYGEPDERALSRRKLAGVAVLGLSLMTKHLLFLFPFWLALRQQGWRTRAVVIMVPVAIFLAGFLPYWSAQQIGIVEHVFRYQSADNGPLYRLLPEVLHELGIARLLWFALLIGGAFVFRRFDGFESLLFYSGLMVAGSPALANQYLAIVMPLVAVMFNPWFAGYALLGAWHLLIDVNGLRLPPPAALAAIDRELYYLGLVLLLWAGLARAFWSRRPGIANSSPQKKSTYGTETKPAGHWPGAGDR